MQNNLHLTIAGHPIRIHWSVLIALPLAYGFTGNVLSGLIGAFAFYILLVVHELGHAFVAWRNKLNVYGINIYMFHGTCTHEAAYSREVEVAVAWGGVLAQGALLVVAVVVSSVIPLPTFLGPLFLVWVPINIFMIFQNLIPMPPLDGAIAWGVIPLAWRRVTSKLSARRNAYQKAKRRSHLKVIK